MEDVANTLRHEPQVRSLAPDQEVEGHVEEFTAELGAAVATSAVVGDPDVGFFPEVGAPGGVVFQELLPEPPEYAGVERVDVVRRRREAHLSVGEVKDQMLALVPNVVALETEEEREPIKEVVVLPPLPERRSTEVADGAKRRGGGTDLREAEGRVVSEEVVHGNDVERLFVAAGGGARRRRGTVAETHSIGNRNPRKKGFVKL